MSGPVRPPQAAAQLARLRGNLAGVFRGTTATLDLLCTAILAGGSVLLEDVPGVGKTTLAKALARSLDLSFNRVQFTPDLLPADILGASIYNPVDGTFQFRPGPIFTQVLLADEINRASPRTQSALLEAMSEGQVTLEGVRRPLPVPFFVVATENPIEFHGTYPLPEAQLDRFLLVLSLGYPTAEMEVEILYDQRDVHPLEHVATVLSAAELMELQLGVRRVAVERSVARYLVDVVQQTRSDAALRLGVSPRGSLSLFRAAQAAAFVAGRDYVLPDDVQRLAGPVLSHRLGLTSQSKYSGTSKAEIIADILRRVPVPT